MCFSSAGGVWLVVLVSCIVWIWGLVLMLCLGWFGAGRCAEALLCLRMVCFWPLWAFAWVVRGLFGLAGVGL